MVEETRAGEGASEQRQLASRLLRDMRADLHWTASRGRVLLNAGVLPSDDAAVVREVVDVLCGLRKQLPAAD